MGIMTEDPAKIYHESAFHPLREEISQCAE